MKPDPNLTEQEQIAVYDAEIRRNLWQVAVLVLFVLAALLKGYTLHVEESLVEADTQVSLAQDLLNSCQAGQQDLAGGPDAKASCANREVALEAAKGRAAGIKTNGFNAAALALFGASGTQN